VVILQSRGTSPECCLKGGETKKDKRGTDTNGGTILSRKGWVNRGERVSRGKSLKS